MPIEFPIRVDGKEYTALLSFPTNKESVVIPGYNLKADIVDCSFGADETEASSLWLEWTAGLFFFLMSKDNLERFLDAISEQGLSSLPITEEDFGLALNKSLKWLVDGQSEKNVRDLVDWNEFVEIVAEKYKLYHKINWDDEVIKECADIAYNLMSDYELFAILENMSIDSLYDLHSGRCECRKLNHTEVRCEVEGKLEVLGDIKDDFIVSGTYAYTDVELENPEWIINDDECDGPKNETEDFLDTLGEDADWEDFIEKNCRLYDYEMEPPPKPDPNGEAAIFINDEFYERFTPENAEYFAEMSEEVIEREGLGESVQALYLRSDIDEDDPDFDETDIENYE